MGSSGLAERPIAITDVTVVPMDRPGTVPRQTVVLHDGRIRAVAPAAEVDVSDFEVVDGTGRYLMPGLADMHVHMWDTEVCGMFLANGVTTVRNMWGAPVHLAYQKAVEKRTIAGPRLVTTSPIVDGLTSTGSTMWPGSIPLTERGTAREMVEGFAARGYRQIKAYSFLKPDALRGLGEASAATGMPLVGHCPDALTFEEAIDAGQTCFEHLVNITHKRLLPEAEAAAEALRQELGAQARRDPRVVRLMAEGIDYESVQRLAMSMAERGVWNCPTLVVMQQMFQHPDVAMADPRNVYESAATLESWDPANDFRLRTATDPIEVRLEAARRRDDMLRNVVGILHEAKAPLLIGSDTPNPFVYEGFGVHDELANFVAAGLSPYEALRCATTEAARFLDETDWGTVAPGQRADLLLLRSDPLADVSAASDIDAVFTNDFRFSREDLEEMLRRRIEAVSPDRPSLPADLDPPADNATTELSRGRMAESLSGARTAQVSYRCCAGERGGRVIDQVSAEPSFVSRRRVWLGADGLLDRAERVFESQLGGDRCLIEWSDSDQTYQVDLEDVDGWKSRYSVGDRRMLPDSRLAELAAPLSRLSGDDLAAVSPDEGGRVYPMKVVRSGAEVEVQIERKSGSSRQTFVLEGDRVVRATSTTWQGERTLEEDEPDS